MHGLTRLKYAAQLSVLSSIQTDRSVLIAGRGRDHLTMTVASDSPLERSTELRQRLKGENPPGRRQSAHAIDEFSLVCAHVDEQPTPKLAAQKVGPQIKTASLHVGGKPRRAPDCHRATVGDAEKIESDTPAPVL